MIKTILIVLISFGFCLGQYSNDLVTSVVPQGTWDGYSTSGDTLIFIEGAGTQGNSSTADDSPLVSGRDYTITVSCSVLAGTPSSGVFTAVGGGYVLGASILNLSNGSNEQTFTYGGSGENAVIRLLETGADACTLKVWEYTIVEKSPGLYIDPTNGDDTNFGNSVTQALETYSEAMGNTTHTLGYFYQKTGTEARETVTVAGSGVADSVITISCYDSATGLTGAAALALGDTAVINGADLVTGWGTTTQEVFTNGDMEAWTADNPDGWTVTEGGSNLITEETVTVHGGSSSLSLQCIDGKTAITQIPTVVAGDTLTLTGWCYGVSAAQTVRLLMTDSEGNRWNGSVWGGYAELTWNGGNGSWSSNTTTFPIEAGVISITFEWFNVTTVDTILIDDVILTRPIYKVALGADPNSVVVDGTFIEEKLNLATVGVEEWYWSSDSSKLFLRTAGTKIIGDYTIETYGRTNVIVCDNKDYVTFDNLHIKGPSQYDGIYGANGGEGIIIQNCKIENIYRYGVFFEGGASDNLDIDLNGNTFTDAGRLQQIYLYPNGSATSTALVDNNTHGYTFYDGTTTTLPASSLMKAMELTRINNVIISNNIVTFPLVQGDTRTILVDSCANPLIEKNVITGGNHGICITDASSGGIVRRNKVTDSYDDGIWIYGTTTGTNINYNIVNGAYDDGIDLTATQSAVVSNNVVTNCIDSGILLRSTATATVKNNICYENGQPGTPTTGDEGGHEIVVASGSSITVANNLYYHTTAKVTATPFDWKGGSVSFAVWEDSSNSSNELNSDPLFTDAANDDFTLQFNSPCIDEAYDWGQIEDYSGNSKSGLAWDIGAFESSHVLGGKGFKRFKMFKIFKVGK